MPEPSLAPAELPSLTDEQLIKRLPYHPATANNPLERRAILDELWSRHSSVVYNHLKIIVFARSSVCPEFVDRTDFINGSFSRAYVNFLQRFRKQEYHNLAGYLCVIAYHAAIEEQCWLTCTRSKSPQEREETQVTQQAGDRDVMCESETEMSSRRAVERVGEEDSGDDKSKRYKPRFSELHSQLPDALYTASVQERRKIIRFLLRRHASESPRSAASTRAVRLFFWRDWTERAIAEDMFANEANLSLDTLEKRIERLIASDCVRLKDLLYKEFSIESPKQI